MQPGREIDADEAAQEIVNVWGMNTKAGTAKNFTADFKELVEKAFAYRTEKIDADNAREFNRLTKEQAEREQRTKKEFMDAFVEGPDKGNYGYSTCNRQELTSDDSLKSILFSISVRFRAIPVCKTRRPLTCTRTVN
jgi:hypothetical protein